MHIVTPVHTSKCRSNIVECYNSNDSFECCRFRQQCCRLVTLLLLLLIIIIIIIIIIIVIMFVYSMIDDITRNQHPLRKAALTHIHRRVKLG